MRDDWQRRGVGSALLHAAIDLADNWIGYTRLELTVFTDNAAAVALYRKFGFEIEGTLRGYAFRDGATSTRTDGAAAPATVPASRADGRAEHEDRAKAQAVEALAPRPSRQV